MVKEKMCHTIWSNNDLDFEAWKKDHGAEYPPLPVRTRADGNNVRKQ